jgi:DNA-binding FadR family transcriptional regulator
VTASASFEPLTPTAFLLRSGKIYADRRAVIDDDYQCSYAELLDRCLRLSGALRNMGVQEGGRVAVLSPNTRLLLESHAMHASFTNADVEWEGRVVSAHHKLASTDRLMERGLGELEQWKRYDGEFHQALISNCGSQVLMDAHVLVFDKYFRYQMVAFRYRGAEPAQQHQALLDCALRRDAEAANAVLQTHIYNCVEDTLATSSLS